MRFAKVVIIAIIVLASGCFSEADFNKILSITELRQTPPYNGPVEVRLPENKPNSAVLFELRIMKNSAGGLPTGEYMEQLKREGARHGANIMVFQCAPPGTEGQHLCIIHGYRAN